MKRKTNIKLVVGLFVIAMILTITTMVSAYSVGMSLASSSKLKAGDTVVVTVSLGTIDAGNGIDTITAELSYDTNVFETLASSNFVASNEWTPSYAPTTNMITLLKNTKVTEGETVLTINLKVKESISVQSTTITLKDIIASGGRVSDGGTGDITVNNASVTLKVDSESTSTTENTTSNTTTSNVTAENTVNSANSASANTTVTTNTTKKNTTIKDNTVTSTTTLPKTGIEQYGVIAIVVVAIVGIFSYVLYKKTSKEVK
jgi:LPXTG-motif cell wall-anchored protein